MRASLLPFLALTLVAGCDQRARSEGVTQAGVLTGAPAAAPSREHESCGTTSHCEAGLRCVEQVCRKAVTSRLGEYHWAAGAAAAQKGKTNDALAAFQLAITQFDTDKVEAPPALLCDYGTALRRKSGDQKAAEQAARLLHRCLLSSPPGSREHTTALRELVELAPAGLEPTLLQRDAPADTYMVRAPHGPATDSLKIDVAQTVVARDKGYAGWVKVLSDEGTKRLLTPCYERYWNTAQKNQLTVVLPVKLRAEIGDDDMYVGGKMELQADPAAAGAEAAASQCVRDALAPLAGEFAKSGSSGSWSGTVTLIFAAPM